MKLWKFLSLGMLLVAGLACEAGGRIQIDSLGGGDPLLNVCAKAVAGTVCDEGRGICYNGTCTNPAEVPCETGFGTYCATGQCQDSVCIPPPDACNSSSDCATGHVCIEGFCRLPGTCSPDCAPGQVCIDDTCRTPWPAFCTGSGDCTSAEVCIEGFCRLPGTCSPDCAPGQVCIDDTCRTPWPALCTGSGDCAPAEVCVEGFCRLPGTCSPACSPEKACVNGACRPIMCNDSVECAANQVCIEGFCRLQETCSPACTGIEVCIDDICRTPWPTPCTGNGDCASAEVCVEGLCRLPGTCSPACSPEKACVNNTCHFVMCNDSADCGPSQTCVDKICRLPENTCSPDCASGQVCVDDTCRTPWPTSCSTSSHCAPAEVCVEGLCRLPETCSPACSPEKACVDKACHFVMCKGTHECGPNQACVDGLCRLKETCSPACTAPHVCVDDTCRTQWPTFCIDDTDCADAESCVNGVCRLPKPGSCTPACSAPYVCVAGTCRTPGSGLCEDDSDCFDGRVCLGGVCRTPVPTACNPACNPGQICTHNNATNVYECRNNPWVLNACNTPQPVDFQRNFAARMALGLPMGFANNHVSIQRGNTHGLMGFDVANNVAFLAWRHSSPVANLHALRQMATTHANQLGENAVISSFTSWNAPSTAANALEVTFTTVGNMSPPARVNAIANTLLGGGIGNLSFNSPAGNRQYVQAQYVLHGNGEATVIMAVVLDDTPGTLSAFGLEDVAGGASLADYLDYSLQQCDSFVATSSGKVDVLFVVDDSGSMAIHQTRLANAAATMVATLNASALEWRAALVTSSYHLPPLVTATNRRIIRGFTEDVQVLQSWLRDQSVCQANNTCWRGAGFPDWNPPAPTCTYAGTAHGAHGGCWVGITGSNDEGTLGAARLALMHMGDAFAADRIRFRADASIFVVLLTDAEDQTSALHESNGDPSAWEPIDNFVNFFGGPNPKNPMGITIPVHAIYCPSGKNCGDDPVPNYADGITRIQRVVQATNGILGDITQDGSIPSVIRTAVEREIGNQGVAPQKPFIGASLRVALQKSTGTCDTSNVPRSRQNGFDYDGMYHTLSFFGTCRPLADSEVVVSYRNWEAWTPD